MTDNPKQKLKSNLQNRKLKLNFSQIIFNQKKKQNYF